jgi:hypothetical protein
VGRGLGIGVGRGVAVGVAVGVGVTVGVAVGVAVGVGVGVGCNWINSMLPPLPNWLAWTALEPPATYWPSADTSQANADPGKAIEPINSTLRSKTITSGQSWNSVPHEAKAITVPLSLDSAPTGVP